MVLIHALRHMRLYGAILVALASLGGAVIGIMRLLFDVSSDILFDIT